MLRNSSGGYVVVSIKLACGSSQVEVPRRQLVGDGRGRAE